MGCELWGLGRDPIARVLERVYTWSANEKRIWSNARFTSASISRYRYCWRWVRSAAVAASLYASSGARRSGMSGRLRIWRTWSTRIHGSDIDSGNWTRWQSSR